MASLTSTYHPPDRNVREQRREGLSQQPTPRFGRPRLGGRLRRCPEERTHNAYDGLIPHSSVGKVVVADTRNQLAGPAFGEGLARAQRRGFRTPGREAQVGAGAHLQGGEATGGPPWIQTARGRWSAAEGDAIGKTGRTPSRRYLWPPVAPSEPLREVSPGVLERRAAGQTPSECSAKASVNPKRSLVALAGIIELPSNPTCPGGRVRLACPRSQPGHNGPARYEEPDASAPKAREG
jgi:hypothetical protein